MITTERLTTIPTRYSKLSTDEWSAVKSVIRNSPAHADVCMKVLEAILPLLDSAYQVGDKVISLTAGQALSMIDVTAFIKAFTVSAPAPAPAANVVAVPAAAPVYAGANAPVKMAARKAGKIAGQKAAANAVLVRGPAPAKPSGFDTPTIEQLSAKVDRLSSDLGALVDALKAGK